MRISEGECETFASIAPPNVDEQIEHERTETLKRTCLMEEEEEMRTREKGGWTGNDSRI